MYTYSVSGYDVNNKKFSPCSLRFIRKVTLIYPCLGSNLFSIISKRKISEVKISHRSYWLNLHDALLSQKRAFVVIYESKVTKNATLVYLDLKIQTYAVMKTAS